MMMLIWSYITTRQNAFNAHLRNCREYSVRSQEAFQAGNREMAEFLLVRAQEELDLCSQYVDPILRAREYFAKEEDPL